MAEKLQSDTFILGKLDRKTILVACPHSFVIKERIKNVKGEYHWVGKYYYSEIGDAIRGYARHVLRRSSGTRILNGNIKDLIGRIEALENTIKTIGEQLTKTWTKRMKDPVEAALLQVVEEE